MNLTLTIHGEHTLVSALWKLHLDEQQIPKFEDVFSD